MYMLGFLARCTMYITSFSFNNITSMCVVIISCKYLRQPKTRHIKIRVYASDIYLYSELYYIYVSIFISLKLISFKNSKIYNYYEL